MVRHAVGARGDDLSKAFALESSYVFWGAMSIAGEPRLVGLVNVVLLRGFLTIVRSKPDKKSLHV